MKIERIFSLTDQDLIEIESLMNEEFESSKYHTIFSKKIFTESWETLFKLPTTALFLLRNDDHRVVGLLAGIICPEIVMDLKNACEISWWVGKEGKGQEVNLLREFIIWGTEMEADRVMVHGWTNDDMPGLKRILEEAGFYHSGFQYCKNLSTSS